MWKGGLGAERQQLNNWCNLQGSFQVRVCESGSEAPEELHGLLENEHGVVG